MFDNLIESKRRKSSRRVFGVGAVSLVVHTVVIAGAVYATLSAGEADNSVKVDTAMVFVDQPKQEKPAVLSGPTLQFPELLRQAQIQGRVLVQAIIDTLGRAEPASVKVLQSPNPGFDQSAKSYVLKALFRPARVHGRAVRVLIQIPIDFRLKQ